MSHNFWWRHPKIQKNKKRHFNGWGHKKGGGTADREAFLGCFFWRSAVPLIKIDSEGIGGRRIEEIWLSRDHQDESSRMVKMTSSDESPRMTDQTQGGEQEMTSPKMPIHRKTVDSPKTENWPRWVISRRWRHPDMKINKYRIINLRDKKKLENL